MDKIKEFLKDGEAALVFTETGRRYLCGFPSSLGYLIVSKENSLFLVDGRYFEAACKAVTAAEVAKLEGLKNQLNTFLAENNCTKLLVETENRYVDIETFRKVSSAEVVPSDALSAALASLRSVKTDEEIASIEKAQRMAEDAFSYILTFIKPGVTENEIAAELEYRMRRAGAEEISFKSIVVSGATSSMPHGVPSDKKVENGDFVTMDFGAMWNGYHSDMTRTVAVGTATEEMKLVYDTVLKAQLAGLEAVKAGVKAADVDKAARDVISAAGYGEFYTHGTGHGVGLEIHEGPTVSSKSDSILEVGNVITVEPGIYLPGKFGVRIEDMAVVTEDTHKNLTNCNKNLIIL